MITEEITTIDRPMAEGELNNTQMNALLSTREDQLSLMLQQIYYSKNCKFFYIGLLIISALLIIVLIIDGFQVAESPMFICLEFLLNSLVSVDLAFRIKLTGLRKFFKSQLGHSRWWNIFDAFVVLSCFTLFLVSLLIKNCGGYIEGTEETLLVIWSVWQMLRIILIAKKHRIARQSAKALINFENIIVDTDFGAQSQRSITVGD
jgi:hypothetical protein